MAILRECALERHRLQLIAGRSSRISDCGDAPATLARDLFSSHYITLDDALSRAGDKFHPTVLAFDSDCEIESDRVVLAH
jgi:hypothetical protein